MIKFLEEKLFKISVMIGVFFHMKSVSAGVTLDGTKNLEVWTQAGKLGEKSGFSPNASLASVIATVIESFLGLLGIIFVVLIILAGYNWMTAGGEEEKVNKAKSTIQRAIIGLVIIVSAYAITFFVFSRLNNVGPLP